MAKRQPRPWYHKQSGNWKVQLNGKQINLGPDESQAWAEYNRLMAAGPSTAPITLYDACEKYLAHLHAKRAPATFVKATRHLQRAIDYLGKRKKVSDLTTDILEAWIEKSYAGTSSTYQNDAISAVFAAINHCGLTNPAKMLEKPSRGKREFYLRPDQWQTLIDAIPDQAFKDYVVFALHTGARPQETHQLDTATYQKDHSRLFWPAELAPKKTRGRGRPRYLYLDATSTGIVERGVPLRNTDGVPWNKDSVNCRFRRLKVKLEMKELCAYSLRHSFCVWKLEQGLAIPMVASLMGHVDSRMVEKKYGHIQGNPTLMMAAANTPSPLAGINA